jgi:hypothetical protein
VKTEIGDLPADLWRLLDEPLPPENATASAQPPRPNRRAHRAATDQTDGHEGTIQQAPTTVAQPTAQAAALDQRALETDPVELAAKQPTGGRAISNKVDAMSLADAPIPQAPATQRKEIHDSTFESSKSGSRVAVSAPLAQPSVIQRQAAAVAETNTADSAGKTDAQTADSTQAAEDKLDTDELARQVYAKLRRQLTVERERLR